MFQIIADKTLRLLQEGSKTVSHRNPSKSGCNIACECCSSAVQLPLNAGGGGGQMLLDHNGQLHTGALLTTDCEDSRKYSVDIVDSMDVEGELEDNRLKTLGTTPVINSFPFCSAYTLVIIIVINLCYRCK